MTLLLLLACGSPEDSARPDHCDDAGVRPLLTWYPDADGDGYGDVRHPSLSCLPGDGWVLATADCDDQDATVNPAAVENCNGKDDNCNNRVDESADLDGDGFLAPTCGGADCNDTDPLVHPEMYDACEDGEDWDCDGIDPACGVSRSLAEAKALLHGDNPNFEAGRLLYVGDVTNDGHDDLLLSTLAAESVAGGAYLVPGPAVSGGLDTLGFRLRNEEAGGGAGRSIAMGDINGDNIGDVGVGIPFGAHCQESIVFGPIAAAYSLSQPDLTLSNTAEGFCGHGSDFLDVNGDGVDDAVIGAYAESTGAFEAGTIYVKYGPMNAGHVDLAEEAESRLIGEGTSFWTGRVVRAAPDLNGDGMGDMLLAAVGATLGGPAAGAVYVVDGPPPEEMSLADANGRLVGEAPYDYAGIAMASGDLNGDGLSDVVVGAQSSRGAPNGGGTYVVFGPADGDRGLADAAILIHGDASGQLAGAGLSVGDVNADGSADLLVGAPGDTHCGEDAGAVYLFLSPVSGSWTVGDASLRIDGTAGVQAGWGVAISDLDADGTIEILVGAPYESTGGTAAGATYLLSF